MTSVDAQAHLDAWLAADLKVASGQSYSIGGRSLSRVDAKTISDQIAYWTGQLNQSLAVEAGQPSQTFAQADFT